MSPYIFDTEAVIAFLYDEPGSDHVAERLAAVETGETGGFLAACNASEVYYLVARYEGTAEGTPTAASLRTAERDMQALQHAGVAIERADWQLVGDIKAHGGLSFADASAAALAHSRGGTLVAGGDDDFENVPVDVDIERFRDHGV